MNHRQISRIATLSLAIAACAAPTAMVGPAAAREPRADQNLVTPDARDAIQTSSPAATAPTTDHRTPDAQDAADGRGTFNAPAVTVVRVPQATSSSTGLDWGDAGIGAGAVLGLTLLALGAGLAIVHRRHVAHGPQTIA